MRLTLGSWILVVIAMANLLTTGQSKMVDMTHFMNENSKHYQLLRDFEIKVVLNRSHVGKNWAFANDISLNEHTGTHIDAPAHTYLGGKFMHEVPLTDLMGPAVVFDLREKAKNDSDYALTVNDIKDHEEKHGQIQEGSIVLLNTGGANVYWDIVKYFGTSTPKNLSTMHFPGFGGPASDFLIRERKIKGIGSDRLSFDVGNSRDLPVHYSISSQGVWGLENINRVEELPERGATVFVMPIPIEKGSGAPSRIFAFTGVDDLPYVSGSFVPRGGILTVITAFVFAYIILKI